MNPNTTDPPPPQPPQPPRSSFSCETHPLEQFTGFCPLCLCERLNTLEPSSLPSSSRPPNTLKSIFKINKSNPSSFFPELRRSQSFSASKNESFSGAFEPQRHSCDIRARKSFNLEQDSSKPICLESQNQVLEIKGVKRLSLEQENNKPICSKAQNQVVDTRDVKKLNLEQENNKPICLKVQNQVLDTRGVKSLNLELENNKPICSKAQNQGVDTTGVKSLNLEQENCKLVSSQGQNQVLEVRGRKSFNLEQDCIRPINLQTRNPVLEIEDQENDEITVLEDDTNVITSSTINSSVTSEEIVVEKSIKDHIDLDSQPKKSSGMKFWSAASVFSKKWQKWMRKETKKGRSRNDGSGLATLPVEKPISRQLRETQSEIADYGFGRRSCDTDPRFSLDVGRMSFDDPRYSYEEPRASWDGYLIGKNFPRLPPMVEDDPVVIVSRTDTEIPVVEDTIVGNGFGNGDEDVPGGSAQTRDYYLDSSSKRRKSLDRSNSIRKTATFADMDDMKVVSNAKVTPAVIDYVNGGRELNGDRHLRELNPNSLRDDCSGTFELRSRDNASVIGNSGEGKETKKSRRWNWKILGFMLPRGGNKEEDGERCSSRASRFERSLSGSWQELRRDGNRETKGNFDRKAFRSNSSVSWRNSYNVTGSFGSMRKSGIEVNGNGKKKEEFVLERNQSARYSTSDIDNGLLRFYLTPLRGSRRGGLGKSRSSNSNSIARSVLRLY
ncbi:protein OCTOPUS [Apium graveolens]|uniref:protein OCTOPUS n=1 Tax=Apium graveolens TaxID=4045 RepID=UPI003D7A7E9B